MANMRFAAFDRQLCRYNCERSPGRVAADGQPLGIGTEVAGVFGRPQSCGVAIFDRCWKFMFWRPSIVDRQDQAPGITGKTAAEIVERFEVTENVPARMKVHEDR